MIAIRKVLKKPLYPLAFVAALGAGHVFFFGLCLVTKTWVKAHRMGLPVDGYLSQFLLGVLGMPLAWFYRSGSTGRFETGTPPKDLQDA